MVERTNKFILVIAGSAVFMIIVFQYVCPGTNCRTSGPRASLQPEAAEDIFPTADPHYVKKYYFSAADLERTVAFDIKGDDVIVFLHIQKTGGTTFGRHLVQNVKLEVPCECRAGQKKCTCYRPNRRETWLFSRFSTGWSCGLHADWTELTNCVPGILMSSRSPAAPLKFYYITMLRDPVSRYLSEWRHVQRGATWKTSLHMCDGRTPTLEELPTCYDGIDWSGCTLQQFMDCPYNLANNRQVRMLADLSLVGCYNMSFITEKKRAQVLLESAKKNLKDMAFFGLTEFQRKTQYLFEQTFHLQFIKPFVQFNSTRAAGVETSNETIERIEELNDLDMQLYDYAKDLFQQRFQYKRQLERMEQRIRNREEQLGRVSEEMPKEEIEEQGRMPTEDYLSHIEKW
uniref:Heparan-sulfate 6-O-sulfotransferase n=1 Tax=Callorhinchus milii TaxID=7868 RepID=A0A4W3J499_CALMI